MPYKHWTQEEEQELRELYPNTISSELCQKFNVKEHSLYWKAKSLGVKKSPEYLKKHVHTMDPDIGAKTRFSSGHKTWNKDTKGVTSGGKQTQFKPGQKPANTIPIGALRNREGYYQLKTTRGFKFLHHQIWEDANGPIPEGYKVSFKDGNRQNLEINNLVLVTQKDLMNQHTILNLPEELQKLVRTKGTLTRLINCKTRRK